MSDDEDTARAALAEAEHAVARSYVEAVEYVRAQVPIAELERAFVEGRLGELLTDRVLRKAGLRLAGAVEDAYRDAARTVARQLADVLSEPVTFAGDHARAVRFVQQATFDAVREVTQETRGVIRQVIGDSLRDGINPRSSARLLRASLGLTEYQGERVSRYRQRLVDGDAAALRYELRDRRFDTRVRAATRVRDRKPLTTEQIDAMTERYARRALAFRAETVARTEALRAVHEGQQEMWTQAVEAQDVDAMEIVREWRHARRGLHSRDGHAAMHGQRRGLGESFRNPLTGASLRFPGDLNASASETLRCRCTVVVRLRPAVARAA